MWKIYHLLGIFSIFLSLAWFRVTNNDIETARNMIEISMITVLGNEQYNFCSKNSQTKILIQNSMNRSNY